MAAWGRRGWAAAIAALVAALVATMSPAEALGVTVGTTPVPGTAQPTFQFNVTPGICQSDTQVTVDGVPGAVVTLTDPNNGTITLPTSTPGGFYTYTVDCDTGEGRVQVPGNLAFFRVIVTKIVAGAPAPGTQFPVSVACTATRARIQAEATPSTVVPPLDATVTFDASGGTRYLVTYTPQTCTVTETDDGGAQRASTTTQDCGTPPAGPVEAAPQAVGPSGSFALYSPADCTQTITNEFPAPAAVPAAAPGVVAARPTFTG